MTTNQIIESVLICLKKYGCFVTANHIEEQLEFCRYNSTKLTQIEQAAWACSIASDGLLAAGKINISNYYEKLSKKLKSFS